MPFVPSSDGFSVFWLSVTQAFPLLRHMCACLCLGANDVKIKKKKTQKMKQPHPEVFMEMHLRAAATLLSTGRIQSTVPALFSVRSHIVRGFACFLLYLRAPWSLSPANSWTQCSLSKEKRTGGPWRAAAVSREKAELGMGGVLLSFLYSCQAMFHWPIKPGCMSRVRSNAVSLPLRYHPTVWKPFSLQVFRGPYEVTWLKH